MTFIPRRVVRRAGSSIQEEGPIAAFRNLDAYVLLGEPGAGKSHLLRHEAQDDPTGRYTTVRAFLRDPIDEFDRNRTLYIDGMDEQRASTGSVNGPLDAMITKLQQLGKPRFRLACREADWLSTDGVQLETTSRNGAVEALHLISLNSQDVLSLLTSWVPKRLEDPQKFVEEASRRGLESLLGNPLLLDLIVSAVEGGQWPNTRSETFEIACKKMAEEHNKEHELASLASRPSTDVILDDAGLLCALLLLADHAAYLTVGSSSGSAEIHVRDLPSMFGLSRPRILAVLNTPLFTAVGDARFYRHRAIAEYLGARALSKRISLGLPVTRILALMTGGDGGIVEPLRGLYAWLASLHSSNRDVLMQHDVLAIILYGDISSYSNSEKLFLLDALYRAAERYTWFRSGHLDVKAFGALGTADMEPSFAVELISSDRTDAHEVLLLCVLEAIEFGERMPGILQVVADVAGDATHLSIVRQAAISALLAQSGSDSTYLLPILDAIAAGQITDPDDELAGQLLSGLYPSMLTSESLLQYFRARKVENFLGSYRSFWRIELWKKIPDTDLSVLGDAIAEMASHRIPLSGTRDFGDLYYGIILHTMQRLGLSQDVAQLYRWLTAGKSKSGYRILHGDDELAVGRALSAEPLQLKSLYEYGLVFLNQGPRSPPDFGMLWQFLNGGELPSDWYSWLLEVAARHDEESIVRHCFSMAAYMAARAPSRFPGGLDKIEAWMDSYGSRWPAAEDWLATETSLSLDHWEKTNFIENSKRELEQLDAQQKRREAYATDVPLLLAGAADPGLHHDVLVVMERGGYDIQGSAPVERVQSLLGVDAATAEAVIEAIPLVLNRTDLPQWQKVIEQFEEGKYFLLEPVCLYAANGLYEKNSPSFNVLAPDTVFTLLAFSLDAGRRPIWLGAVMEQQPQMVGTIMLRFLTSAWDKKSHQLGSIGWLNQGRSTSNISREVVHSLLPHIAPPFDGDELEFLFKIVLPAVFSHADSSVLEEWVEGILSREDLSVAARTVALTASLGYSSRHLDALLSMLVANEGNAVACGSALVAQHHSTGIVRRMVAIDIGKLVARLARVVSPTLVTVRFLRPQDKVGDAVKLLVTELASRPAVEATRVLAGLRDDPSLEAWNWQLAEAAYQSSKLVREVQYSFASPSAVMEVLINRVPANAPDLIAYFLDHVDTLMRRIRYGQTNLLQTFLRGGNRGQDRPRVENDCRNLFLELINPDMLPMGVHLEKERPTAGDKRSDMSVTLSVPGKKISVPVEIKLDGHQEVWTAWDHQLMGLYVTDPVAEGRGIYLVMYFGRDTKVSPLGTKPISAEDMARIFNSLIPLEYLNRMHGLVLDFS
jgi:hypothetical protein